MRLGVMEKRLLKLVLNTSATSVFISSPPISARDLIQGSGYARLCLSTSVPTVTVHARVYIIIILSLNVDPITVYIEICLLKYKC